MSVEPQLIRSSLPGEASVLDAAERSLRGERRGIGKVWPFLGPAFIASIAYVDPGNFATNMAAGSQYGYMLLWVILASNLMAMIVQSMSAKLGIATGQNLAEVCRVKYRMGTRIVLWVIAEVIAMATDLAEFIGASVALQLLFGLPLPIAAVLTGIVAFGILSLQSRGFRRFEAVIAGFVLVIVAGFGLQLLLAKPEWSSVFGGLVVPQFRGTESVLLACGILGATVMPHVIYLHSALTQQRLVGADEDARRRIFRFELIDVVIAMGLAGLINMSMLVIAAATFHDHGLTNISDLDAVFNGLREQLGNNSHIMFGIALLASGLSSSSVGTLSGQVVMQGFIERSIPLNVRRAVTMLPAFVVVLIGVNPSRALIMSQVVLSFGIPFALIPLLSFCRDRELMGSLVNRRITTMAATVVVALIVSLNAFLLWQTFTG